GGGGVRARPAPAVPAAPASVLPLIGSKEFIASLPAVLGCGPGDTVVYPELAYPTYAVGALLAGATAVAADGLSAVGPGRVALVWGNSPANPTRQGLPVAPLRKMVDWARGRGPGGAAGGGCRSGAGLDPAPRGVRRVRAGRARGALPVQALEHGRLPGRVCHR